jgi:hypothetical protein
MNSIDDIIEKIALLQETANRNYFPSGIFESYRRNVSWWYQRPDTNVFCTAITLFTLQGIQQKQLSTSAITLIDQICKKGKRNYQAFQSKDGIMTYNFFQTKPNHHFPHGKILHRLNKLKLADDIDCTALVYLTNGCSAEDAFWLQKKLRLHYNGYKKTIKNTFPEYRSLRAYSTYFGEHMRPEFDACALSNLLYCLLYFELELDDHAHDSIQYIKQCVLSNQYLLNPFTVACYYPKAPLIIYHIVRLITRFDIPALVQCRDKITEDIYTLLSNNTLSMIDTVLLETSLFRLKESYCSKINFKSLISSREVQNYSFFVASLLRPLQNPILDVFAPLPLFQIQWCCEAHTWALIAEWMALQKK